MLARNILIFHSAALGDFILTFPLGLALGRMNPQSRVMYVTAKQKGELAEKVLGLDSIDSETGWHYLFGDPSKLPEPCSRKLQDSHTIITFLAKPGDNWFQNVSQIAPKAKIICVGMENPSLKSEHYSQQLLQSLQDHPVLYAGFTQILASVANRGLARSAFPKGGPILIHPGSGSPTKCWPAGRFLELIIRLKSDGQTCRIVLGEVEIERWSAELIRKLEAAAPVICSQTYLQLLAEIQQSSAFIGNDSGATHLAGILGLPTFAIFGPTDPAIWKPLGPRVQIIRHEPLNELPCEDVYRDFRSYFAAHSP
jgi:ADP-heptose:LPS heptosyltransferase